MQTVMETACSGIATLVLGGILQFSGFDETAAVQTEQVQRLGICEDLAQRTQLVRRVGVAGQRK